MIVNSPEYMRLRSAMGACELFDECSDAQIDGLLQTAYGRKLTRGKRFFDSGDQASEVFVLLDGGVKLCSETPAARPKVMQLVYPTELFGMFDVLTDGQRDLSAVAMSTSEALVVAGDAFLGLLNENARFAVRILSGWGARFREFSTWCFRYNHYGAREKVAAFLIKELSEREDQRPCQAMPTRRDIASLLGITPETLSRELSYFRKNGWVDVDKNGALTVSDTRSLGILLEA